MQYDFGMPGPGLGQTNCGGIKHVNVIQSFFFDNWISKIYAHIHPLNTNNTITYNVINPGPGLGQAQHVAGLSW